MIQGTPLVVQWLRFHTLSAREVSLDGNWIPHATTQGPPGWTKIQHLAMNIPCAAMKTSHSQMINIKKKIKIDFLTLPAPHNPVRVVSLCSAQTGKGGCFSTCLHGWPGYLLWPTECSRINLPASAWKGFLCFPCYSRIATTAMWSKQAQASLLNDGMTSQTQCHPQ